ncbi:MAG TPA: WXG100 family type VII secretion target [Jatrophihabitans sp.]
MTPFGAQQQSMALAATAVEQANAQIGLHITTLRGEVDQMMGGWRGDAAGAFMQVHEAFEGQATKISTALETMLQALIATSDRK